MLKKTMIEKIIIGKSKEELNEIIEAAEIEYDRLLKEERKALMSKIEVGKYYYTSDGISCNFYYKILSIKPFVETFEVTTGDYNLIDPDKIINENILKNFKETTKEVFIDNYNIAINEIQKRYEEIIE